MLTFFFSTDNVTLELDGVLYTKVFDPYKVGQILFMNWLNS